MSSRSWSYGLPSADVAGAGWWAEVKWDGARCLAYVKSGQVRLAGRSGTDFTARFPEVAEALETVEGPLVLDGEIVVMQGGRPSFHGLQSRVHRSRPASIKAGRTAAPAILVVFDVLHTERPLLTVPYEERRGLLESLNLELPQVRVPPAWPSVADAFDWTRGQHLEGIVAKRAGSLYRPGARSRDWVKSKHLQVADVVIGGWLPGGRGGTSVRAVLAGVPAAEGGQLLFVGAVGTGFADAERRALGALLQRLSAPTSPFVAPVGGMGLPTGTEVRFAVPRLHAEVEFLELTPAGRLRHPVWRGLRDDDAAPGLIG
ncbi:ATP-dependent DNA ligase [Kitasatospora sp. NPDC101801]|uniref:ATP-dependent DNA ligase n=1 Tax=Kitasatospora sp. NPDC101801 TaxID=3364103 RepID=UPI00380EA39A